MPDKTAADRDALWLERLSKGGRAALRLFCFPYAGGNARAFRDWEQRFPPEVELCLVHLPGRGRRFGEPLFTRLSHLVDVIAEQVRWELQVTFALYGHSMGALISFELSRELRRRYGIEPVQLFLSGRRAPHLMSIERPAFNLPREEFITELRNLDGTPGEVLDHAETMDLFLPVLRADFEMIETYEYQPEERLCCPITAYGGLQDQRVPMESLQAWAEHTWLGCKVRMFPGNHFFIHSSSAGFVDILRRDVLGRLRMLRQQCGIAAEPGSRMPI